MKHLFEKNEQASVDFSDCVFRHVFKCRASFRVHYRRPWCIAWTIPLHGITEIWDWEVAWVWRWHSEPEMGFIGERKNWFLENIVRKVFLGRALLCELSASWNHGRIGESQWYRRPIWRHQNHNASTLPSNTREYEQLQQLARVSKQILLLAVHSVNFLCSIGLVHIDRPIIFNQYVQPIALVRRRYIGTGFATLAGFGADVFDIPNQIISSPENLQFSRLQIITNLECTIRARLYGPLEPMMTTPIIYSGHICTMARRGVGACFGDSGSMLFTRDGVVGVVATTVLPCARGAPDVFVRVSTYIGWIDSYIHNLS